MERSRTKSNAPANDGTNSARLTTWQIGLLVGLAALVLIGLTLVLVLLFSTPPVVETQLPLPQDEPPAAVPPPVVLPAAQTAAPLEETLAPRQLLPVGCEPIYGSLVESSAASIVDGQTLDVTIGQTPARVRLAGIFVADESALSGATGELQAMIDKQPVVLALDGSEPDAQGRLPAYVFSNGWFLNQELVLRGFARVDPGSPGQACVALFQTAEQQAQQGRKGIWQPTRVPTATFLPTVGIDPALQAPCDCMSRPVCTDFQTHDAAQSCYNACNDYNSHLDDDRDGLACEGLP